MQEPNMETKKDFTPTPEQIDKVIQRCEDSGWCKPQSYADFKYELAKDYIAAYENEKNKSKSI